METKSIVLYATKISNMALQKKSGLWIASIMSPSDMFSVVYHTDTLKSGKALVDFEIAAK